VCVRVCVRVCACVCVCLCVFVRMRDIERAATEMERGGQRVCVRACVCVFFVRMYV